MCFNFISDINAQIVKYLIVLTFEVRMIYSSLRFSLMAFTYTFYICKGKKNEKLKKSISKKTKGRI